MKVSFQLCVKADSHPYRRIGRRGLPRGTPQASVTVQRRPIWIKSFCLLLLGLLPVCCSRREDKAAVRGVEVVVGEAGEGALAPHPESVCIVPGLKVF